MTTPGPRRALILAGGGLKVAFQAGVLQVWLDEAGLTFDHADGASGGCFNLAMYVQGMRGRQIAENWRRYQPLTGLGVNLPQLDRLAFARSLFTYDAYRAHVFPAWGLDWQSIRASPRSATFNYWNFSRMRLETVAPAAMDEDKLVACVSLPMWFPPVMIDGDACIDAVYNTDANLEDSIRRGADELWIIWTVSEAGRWADGFVNNYFQIIEVAANGRLNDVLVRIEANNTAISAGGQGEFGRKITVKFLRAEVDLNYLLEASTDRFAEAVNAGIDKARAWCAAENIAVTPLPDPPPPAPGETATLQFSEVMKGYVSMNETDYDAGFRKGSAADTPLTVRLTIRTEDAGRFITDPHHEAPVTGTVDYAPCGGERRIEKGVFNLLVDTQDPERKLMTYRLQFTDAAGLPTTIVGFKDVRPGAGHDPWTTTTTLFTRLLRGDVGLEAEDIAPIIAAGIIRIHMLDFLAELTTFRVTAPTVAGRLEALTRFGALFFGKLWDVYAARILPASPI